MFKKPDSGVFERELNILVREDLQAYAGVLIKPLPGADNARARRLLLAVKKVPF